MTTDTWQGVALHALNIAQTAILTYLALLAAERRRGDK